MAKLDWILYRIMERFRQSSGEGFRRSWSQCGEDLIARFVFDALHIPVPTFLDIGAHHPTFLNNTQLFYSQGSHGVNIEPDPSLFSAFLNARPRDVNLNVGIADRQGEMDFFVLSAHTLNTFSENDARSAEREGRVRIEEVVRLPVVPINSIMDTYFPQGPDFFTLDVEGLDLTILQGLDFKKYRPKVVCVETITYSENRTGKKILEIADTMRNEGYFPFADTYVNTIFVDESKWLAG